MSAVTALVLAAGQGTRMKSALPKVLHPVGGKPMIGHVVDTCRRAGIGHIVVVVGVQREKVMAYLGESVEYAFQEEQLGTGHAVLQAQAVLGQAQGDLLVLFGDAPLLRAEAVEALLAAHRQAGAHASILTAEVPDPGMLGRVVRDSAGRFVRVVEYKDATPAERAIHEVWSGAACFRLDGFWDFLRQIRNENAQREYYLLDVLPLMQAAGRVVQAVCAADADDVLAPNDRRELARAEAVFRRRILDRLMLSGVTVMDPETTWVSAEAEIAPDTVLLPFTFIEGKTAIESGCVIGPMTRVVGSRIGAGARIEMSVVEESTVGPGCRIGPYAHLRPGCELGPGCEVGNYAEMKNVRAGAGVKMHHHGYLGDAEVGERANIGAGVITSNYDGVRKHRTVIEAGAFIGTNANLVAPVRIGAGAYVAAGSTINRDVPADALAIARARQENKEGYASRLRARAHQQSQQRS